MPSLSLPGRKWKGLKVTKDPGRSERPGAYSIPVTWRCNQEVGPGDRKGSPAICSTSRLVRLSLSSYPPVVCKLSSLHGQYCGAVRCRAAGRARPASKMHMAVPVRPGVKPAAAFWLGQGTGLGWSRGWEKESERPPSSFCSSSGLSQHGSLSLQETDLMFLTSL